MHPGLQGDVKAEGIASCGELRKEPFGGAQQLSCKQHLRCRML